MNILFFTQHYPKSFGEPVVSGMVKNPFYLSQTLQEKGNEVSVITYGREKGRWNFDGVRVHCEGKGFLKGVVKAFFLDIKMTRRFLKLRKKESFDVIHIHSGNLMFLFFLRKIGRIKIPIIYSVHGTSTPELKANIQGRKSLKNFLLRVNGKVQEWIDGYMWRSSDHAISGSKYQMKEMEEIYGVPKEKMVCIYNGVDETRYCPDNNLREEFRRKHSIAQDAPVVFFVGRVARKKGVHLLINNAQDVIREFPNARFLLVLGSLGSQGDYKKEVLELVEKENLTDYFIIKEDVPEKDLPAYYNTADLCIFPSTGYESIPTVIYEAMACGKPIITQGSWGIKEVLEETLLPEEKLKTQALSQKIVETLKDGEVKKKAVEYGERKTWKFNWKELSDQCLELYKSKLVIR